MLHPDFSYVLFTDEDILAFIRERTPSWLPLYKGLTHHAIQRVDLFRYLAVSHWGGFYLDLDVPPPPSAPTLSLAPPFPKQPAGSGAPTRCSSRSRSTSMSPSPSRTRPPAPSSPLSGRATSAAAALPATPP